MVIPTKSLGCGEANLGLDRIHDYTQWHITETWLIGSQYLCYLCGVTCVAVMDIYFV